MACEHETKERHSRRDFWHYKLLSAVPLAAALAGFWRTEPWMMAPYLAWIALHITLVYRLLCTHCPHYGAYEGKTQCQYLWNVPAVYLARPGPQALWEKVLVNLLLAVSILLPVYWLAQVGDLLVIYLLGVAGLLVTMMRYECVRCVNTDCPHYAGAAKG